MMMDNLPKVAENHIKEQFKALNKHIVAGEVQKWLDTELQSLHDSNPVLYHFVTERANKFAMGALMSGDPQAVAISMALEYLILLKILNTSIGDMLGLGKFTDMMTNWFGNDELKGLNGLGNEK
jgi:hypothetical protein